MPFSFRRNPAPVTKLLRMRKHVHPTEYPPLAKEAPAPHPLTGKLVTFEAGGVRVAGRVAKHVADDQFVVQLALPNKDGILTITQAELVHPLDGLEEIDAPAREQKVCAFAEQVPFEIDQKMVAIKNGDVVVDYKDVIISGYASTFAATTPADRDGDYIVDGAFDETLRQFKSNPVMLVNHDNRVQSLAGSYSKIGVNRQGLAIEGRLTNAPDMQSVRFKVAEGHLKALSIGGFFFYGVDGRAVEKVDLFEISLVPVPANPDALISTRAIELSDCTKSWSRHQKRLQF